jgi:hypothetical protein
VLGRIEQDLFQIDPVGLLELSAFGDRHPSFAQALGELIADALELPEVEEPRIGGVLATGLTEAAHRVGGNEGVRQLTLELGDLTSQRAPCRQLVGRHVRFAKRQRGVRLPDFLI